MSGTGFDATILAHKPLVLMPGLLVALALLVLWQRDRRYLFNLYWAVGQILSVVGAAVLPVSQFGARGLQLSSVIAVAFASASAVSNLLGVAEYGALRIRPLAALGLWLGILGTLWLTALFDTRAASALYDVIAVSLSLVFALAIAPFGVAERVAGVLMCARALNGVMLTAVLPGYTQLQRVEINHVVALATGLALLCAGFLRAARELRDQRAMLERTVAARTADLRRTHDELEALTHSVAHDLCEPLEVLDADTRVLLETQTARLDEEGRALARRIRGGAQRMRLLIDKLLELSRLSQELLRREPLDLAPLAQATLTRLREIHPERSVQAVVAPNLPATGDAGLLGIVLDNLIGNAWKYSSRTGAARIEVGEERAGRDRVFYVRDNGAGFDMQFAGKLFGAFQRLHDAREFEGTGVGLATVQRIVHRHGGRIWAESALGRGATFRFTLPDA